MKEKFNTPIAYFIDKLITKLSTITVNEPYNEKKGNLSIIASIALLCIIIWVLVVIYKT